MIKFIDEAKIKELIISKNLFGKYIYCYGPTGSMDEWVCELCKKKKRYHYVEG